MNSIRLKAEINKTSLVLRFSWAEVLFYGFFIAFGFFGAATPSYTNFVSNINVGVAQTVFLSFCLVLLGVMGWKWGEKYEDSIAISSRDWIVLVGVLILLFGLGYESLGRSIQGDESAYLLLAYGHSIKALLKFGQHFPSLSAWPVIYLVQFSSLLLVGGVALFIWVSRKLQWPMRIAVVLAALLFCRALIMYFGGNPSPHPPLGGAALLISGTVFGINDFALKSAYFAGYVLFIFGIYKILNRVTPWYMSVLFALSVGTIPVSLHLAGIVENSTWSLICFTLIMLELVTDRNANLVRLASFVSIMTLFRQPIFIGYVPILLVVFLRKWDEMALRKGLLSLLLPSLVFVPFLMQSLLHGTPSTVAMGDQTSQLARVIAAFGSGIILISIANALSKLWLFFIPCAFIWWGSYRAQSIAFLIFFMVALVMYYAISPGLYGMAKYQAEYAVPFSIVGALMCYLALIRFCRKDLLALSLFFVIGFNVYSYLQIPSQNKPIDTLIDTLLHDSNTYNSGYHVLCGFPYEFGQAYEEVKRLGLTSNSYAIGVTYGVFLEIVNGYSWQAVREAESISRLQKQLNGEASPPSSTIAIDNIEKDPRIKIVVLGAIQKRAEMIDEFVRHGWAEHASYKNAQYGSSVVVMTKIAR